MRLQAFSSAGLVSVAVCLALTALVRPVQAQERLVEWSAHPLVKLDQSASTTKLANVKEAVEIVEVKVGEASITLGRSFLAGDDWLRGLNFRMKNVSGRPIIGARLSFSLPETLVDHNGLGFSLEYGRGESTGILSDEQKVVMPNEEFELKFNEPQYQRHRQFVTSRSKLKSFNKITIGTLVVKFDDESIWVGGCLRASDPTNSCHAPLPIESAANTQSFSEVQLSVEGQKAYRTLLAAKRFEDKAIGYGAAPSKLVEAYCVLLKESAADAAFKSLLEHATLPGQLYALCGLYFTDPNFFRSAVEKFRHSDERVDTLFGCIGGLMAVSTLVESKKPIVIDPNQPEQSLHAHIEANTKAIMESNGSKRKRKGDKPPEGYQLDILNGGYSVWFRCR